MAEFQIRRCIFEDGPVICSGVPDGYSRYGKTVIDAKSPGASGIETHRTGARDRDQGSIAREKIE
jgi:hypothetical protein